MAIAMKPVADIAAKFVKRAQAAAPEYEAGVKAPKKDWATETKAAEGSYTQGVTEAIGRGAFGKGVAEAGTGKWQEKAVKLGPQRFSQGVAGAGGDYAKGFGPVAEALSRVVLPAKGPRGAAQNIERVRAVDDALAALRKK